MTFRFDVLRHVLIVLEGDGCIFFKVQLINFNQNVRRTFLIKKIKLKYDKIENNEKNRKLIKMRQNSSFII